MPTLCCIPSCKSSSSLHLFPKDLELRAKWIHNISLINWETPVKVITRTKICIQHFKNEDFYKCKNKTFLYPERIPSIFKDMNGVEIIVSDSKKDNLCENILNFKSDNNSQTSEFFIIYDIHENRVMEDALISIESCLICLSTAGIQSIYNKEIDNISLANKIESFTDIKLNNDNTLPDAVCTNCAKRVDDCFKLKKQCEESIQKFIMFQKKNTIVTENFQEVNILTDSNNFIASEDCNSSNNIESYTDNTNQFENDDTHESILIFENLNLENNLANEFSELENKIGSVDSLKMNENDAKSGDQISNNKELNYQCEKCSKNFTERIKLIKHLRTHNICLICQICGLQFKSSKSLNSHILSHNTDNEKHMHKCDECDKVFKYLSVLREHQILHTNEKPYECDKCDKKFQQKIKLTRHLNIHTEEKKIICEICSKQFHSVHNLNGHKLIHGPSKYKCSECDKLFHTASGLRSHFLRHKGIRYPCDQCDLTFSGSGSLNSHKKSIHLGIRNYKCVVCGNEYFNSYNYKQHVLSHTGEKPYACDICHRKFSQRSVKIAHMERMHNIKTDKRNVSKKNDEIHQCNVCKKILNNSENLKRHLKIHVPKNTENNENNLQCEICNKILSNKLTLRYHMRIHSSDNRYECPVCKKKFVSLESRKLHSRIHSGERPFKCSLCPEVFISKAKCVIHERKHTGKTPYQCSVCEKYLNDKPHLEIHMRVHTGEKPFSCPHCDKRFAATGNRDAHIRIHTGEKPYSCKQCDAQFHRLKVLRKHIEKEHSKVIS